MAPALSDPSPAPSPAAESAAPSAPSATSSPSSPLDLAKARLDAMLRSGRSDPAWFADSFLAQIPASKVDQIVALLKTSLGDYRSVDCTSAACIAHFAKATDEVQIHLDDHGKIDGLLFKPPVMSSASLDGALISLRPQSGTLSYIIVKGGRLQQAALDASEPLAVGSAFKLAVLNALDDDIRSGKRRWSDVVPLRPEWKSLPSGLLRSWPDATPLTLATLAAQMISISDNTAADALIRIIGPTALQTYAGKNEPFITTREMFALKSAPNNRLRSLYRQATTPAARVAVLERIDRQPQPDALQLVQSPMLDIEWHYSVRDLCHLISRVSAIPLMSINPGVAEPARFRHVAFKGGSDIGVTNLTTALVTSRGTNICFSATLNDAARAVDETAFESAYRGVLQFLEDE